jgi:CRP-like cAMP-binding protein
MLVLASGELKVCHFSADRSELILASIMPGQPIGELGMNSHLSRAVTVIAAKPSGGMMPRRATVIT